jgi:drug/metabolite transporter (DMT)-like permease
MDRPYAVFWSTIWILVFFLIARFGIGVTDWSSLVFAFFVGIVLLMFFYPVSNLASDPADYSLYLYAGILIFGFTIFTMYVIQKTLTDIK